MGDQGSGTASSDFARHSWQAEVACWSELGLMLDGGKAKPLGTASHSRPRLPGDTLIEFNLGLGLHWPEYIALES